VGDMINFRSTRRFRHITPCFRAGSGTRTAMARFPRLMTREGIRGTIQPVWGQRASRQYINALAGQPGESLGDEVRHALGDMGFFEKRPAIFQPIGPERSAAIVMAMS